MLKYKTYNSWQVPDFNLIFWRKKSSNYCLVIPVINEGDRLKKLLERLKKLHLDKIVDILIVDGGSQDDSTNLAKLKKMNVSGFIIKTGPGKLSSQLRCAYAFAIKKRYKGIITIDGNNKDNPSSIPSFIKALDSGYDFVQASRFIKRGVHKNTPILRYIAIKLIHAPILSFFSGFHWTDTTQGFRGYSVRFLEDWRVNIFRDIFIEYELLAYLSYRAPKLNFKCIELPTMRIYPENEVPTKISFLRGNFKMLMTLFSVCLGRYNP